MHRIVLTAMSAALLALTACDNKSPGGGGSGLSADEKAVIGKWVIDPAGLKAMMIEEFKKANTGTEPTAEQLAQFDEAAKGMSLEVEFKDDKSCAMSMKMGPGDPETAKGTWSYAAGKYTIKTTEKNGKPAKDEKDGIATLKDGKLMVEAGPGPAIPLIKKT